VGRWRMSLVLALSLIGAPTYAQEMALGPATGELSLIPGGSMFFVGSNAESAFSNYSFGAALTYNANRIVGVEIEGSGTLGITQDLAGPGPASRQRTPSTLGFNGNLVLSAPVHDRLVPYVTGGGGGLTMFQNSLTADTSTTFLTGNTGGGLKWYAARHVGLRGDYRFMVVRSNPSASAFFGQETRYGHRVYAGLIFDLAR
jgi:hypothetical protein